MTGGGVLLTVELNYIFRFGTGEKRKNLRIEASIVDQDVIAYESI